MATVGRLKRRPDFLRVAAARRRWAPPGLVLQAARRDGEAASAATEDIRLGFTVTRKVGNAVQRNRARRRLRAASALMADHAAPGYDYVLIGRAGTLTRPFADLGEDLTTALKKLGLYRPGSGAMKGMA